ncbi:alpha/beta-hydrolase [Decorospora gaudefroyi]|uniref:Alpha/beta-hydrolase n=1 Tax=Decorospora gaudefroyi TaxID=184978 RepID=A0A6A5K8K2_9PLEO|nr:alpha/beta-hydrolase [Decorospora gaudefroyi]
MSKHIHSIEPSATHTHTIILLHGRGSTALEFATEFFESQASDDRFLGQIFPNYKWVFPCAALRYARIEDEDLHQWFDMVCVQKPYYDPEKRQIVGLRESVGFVREVMEREAREVGGFDKVFVGGISQGCAMAITACLAVQRPLAGFIAFSGWCPFAKLGGSEVALLQTSVLVEHALDDEVVPLALGRDLRDTLKSLGSEAQLVEYEDGGHWINEPKGIDDMVHFIKSKTMA